MLSNPVLAPHRADALRHLLLALAAVAGVAAAGYVLSSQAVTDFLREGAVRFTGLEGETLRVVLGLGALAATGVAVGALWDRVTTPRLLVAAAALGGGLFLVHAVLMPMAALLTVAVCTDFSRHVPRERFEQARRNPVILASGALVAAGALAAGVWVSIWLLGPLFDEGTTLNEMLGFEVAGLVEPEVVEPDATEGGEAMAAMPIVPDAMMTAEEGSMTGEATGMGTPGAGDAAADPEGTGSLISSGELMGTDAFHTGSGDVLLVSDPDGNLILRFQEYAVQNGPDLFVYLTPDPEGDVHADGAVNLGEIRATNGFVNYEVPADVDPASFGAAVIYCRAFSVIFAVAELT